MESGSTSAEETSSSTDLHPLQSNLGDASCMWESWTGHDASSAGADELITSTANSAADQALGCTSSSRQLLTFQQQSDILSSPGWFSGFCNPICPPHAASGIMCQNPGAADPAADDPPCTSSFTSDGQLVQSAMCNSSPDPDQYCDIAGFEFADHRYIRTAAKHHHPESAHYYSMSPTACDEGLSSESYSNYSRADNKSVYAKPLQVAPLTALQLLQSIDPESPSSPLSLYHNSPLPSFGNWDGGAGHHGLPASTWVDCSPPTSQSLAGCTTLRLMHHDADGGQSTDAGSCQYNSTELQQLQASSKRELFPAMTDTSAPADPYYTISHPARPAICDHPSISSCMIDGAVQYDPALIQGSSGTRGLLCNTENLLNASRVNCFSTPWSPFSHEDIQLDSGNSGRGSMEVLSSALSEGERRTSGSLCFSQDFQLTQLEERAASRTVGMTTVLANAVHTSCSGSEILVADPAPQHLRDLQRPAAANHRLELVEIDCDDVEASPAPRPKRKATYVCKPFFHFPSDCCILVLSFMYCVIDSLLYLRECSLIPYLESASVDRSRSNYIV
jgi:hypothetical protein